MKANFWKLILTARVKWSLSLHTGMLFSLLVVTPCVAAPPPLIVQTVPLAKFTFETSRPSGFEPSGVDFPYFNADWGSGMATAWHSNACYYLCRTGNGSDHCFCGTNWTVGDFWQFQCTNYGASNIMVSFDLVGSPTAPKYYQLQYSTDGSMFINATGPGPTYQPYLFAVPIANFYLTDGPKCSWSSSYYHKSTHYTADLSSITALNNANTIWFRLMDASNVPISAEKITSAGTARVDNFDICGTESFYFISLAWPNLESITYGRALDFHQLNACASVPGTFDYIPSAGAILNTGTNILTTIFTPSNIDYTAATDTVALVVNPAPLMVSAFNAARTVGTTNPIFCGSIYGLANGDNITASYSCSAKIGSSAGDYSIIPALNDPNSRLMNYIVTTNLGTLTVSTGPIEEIILAQWNFNNTNLASAALPGGVWYSNIQPQLGSGTASGWHQNASVYWNLTNGTGYEFSSTNWVPGDFWQFVTLPTNASDLSIRWHQSSSGSGPGIIIATEISEYINEYLDAQTSGGSTDVIPGTCDSGSSSPPSGVKSADGSGTSPDGLFSDDSTALVLNFNGDGAEPTNVLIRLTDGSPCGAGGGRVGPYGDNSIIDFTIYGAVPLPPGTPVIWWTPQPVNYGTPLGPGQLNATASTCGTFSYNPGPGTILSVGTNTLTLVFTPTDTNAFTVTNSVNLVVSYAPNTTLIEPTILSPGVFQFTISNIGPGTSYTVLSTTNLLTPITNWTTIGSASYLSPGLYQFVDSNAPAGNNFYMIRSP